MDQRKRLARHGRRQQDGKDHHPDPVIEQAFAGNRRLQRRRHARGFQHPHDRDRVSRADQGPEHQAPDQRHRQAHRRRQAPEPDPDQERRGHHPDRRQDQDLPASLAKVVDVDVHRPREQQERQHPVHQGLVEVDSLQEARHGAGQVTCRGQEIDRQDDQGRHRPHHGQGHGARQFEPAQIDPGEAGGQDNQNGGGFKSRKGHRHRCPPQGPASKKRPAVCEPGARFRRCSSSVILDRRYPKEPA
jgi:hypothetical protein